MCATVMRTSIFNHARRIGARCDFEMLSRRFSLLCVVLSAPAARPGAVVMEGCAGCARLSESVRMVRRRRIRQRAALW